MILSVGTFRECKTLFDGYIWPRSKSNTKPTPLWLSQKSGPLTASTMRQMIYAVFRDAATRGLVPAKASAHTLGDTFARNYLSEYPGDVVGLATLLRHTSLDTTRIYSQPTVEILTKRVEQLSQNAYAELREKLQQINRRKGDLNISPSVKYSFLFRERALEAVYVWLSAQILWFSTELTTSQRRHRPRKILH